MKHVLLVTIIAFILSFLLGLFSGVLFSHMFFRAIISTVFVLILGTVLNFSVKKFLPGILSKNGSNKIPEKPVFQDNKIGSMVDVRLNEEPVPQHNNRLLNDEEFIDNSDFNNQKPMKNSEVSLQKSNKSITTAGKDVFLETNPDVLAKMIRTRLSDDKD